MCRQLNYAVIDNSTVSTQLGTEEVSQPYELKNKTRKPLKEMGSPIHPGAREMKGL